MRQGKVRMLGSQCDSPVTTPPCRGFADIGMQYPPSKVRLSRMVSGTADETQSPDYPPRPALHP